MKLLKQIATGLLFGLAVTMVCVGVLVIFVALTAKPVHAAPKAVTNGQAQLGGWCSPCQCEALANARGYFTLPSTPGCPDQCVNGTCLSATDKIKPHTGSFRMCQECATATNGWAVAGVNCKPIGHGGYICGGELIERNDGLVIQSNRMTSDHQVEMAVPVPHTPPWYFFAFDVPGGNVLKDKTMGSYAVLDILPSSEACIDAMYSLRKKLLKEAPLTAQSMVLGCSSTILPVSQ